VVTEVSENNIIATAITDLTKINLTKGLHRARTVSTAKTFLITTTIIYQTGHVKRTNVRLEVETNRGEQFPCKTISHLLRMMCRTCWLIIVQRSNILRYKTLTSCSNESTQLRVKQKTQLGCTWFDRQLNVLVSQRDDCTSFLINAKTLRWMHVAKDIKFIQSCESHIHGV